MTRRKMMRCVRDALQQHWRESVLDDLLIAVYDELYELGLIEKKRDK